jgi:hypothetical protein
LGITGRIEEGAQNTRIAALDQSTKVRVVVHQPIAQLHGRGSNLVADPVIHGKVGPGSPLVLQESAEGMASEITIKAAAELRADPSDRFDTGFAFPKEITTKVG